MSRRLLLSILIAQFLTLLILVDIGYDIRAIRQQPVVTVENLAELRADLVHLTHPATLQRRTLDYILRQNEFQEVK
jgi:hypothetical protein